MPETHHEIVQRLISRWPEHRIAPGTARVEALCEIPIDIVSTGPERDETILRSHPFA